MIIPINYRQTELSGSWGIDHFEKKYGLEINRDEEGISRIIIQKSDVNPRVTSWVNTDYGELPLFSDKACTELIEEKNSVLQINFDVFNTVGHILNGLFEKLPIGDRKQLADIPVIDIYEDMVFEAIQDFLAGQGMDVERKPLWPDGKKFAVCLTHDVDEIRKTYQYITHPLKSLKRGDYSKSAKQMKLGVSDKLTSKKPYWNFEEIMKIEAEFGVKSTFYFLQEEGKTNINPKTWMLYARKYRFSDERVIKVMKDIASKNWEVGLHGSYYSFQDGEMLRKQKNELENAIEKPVNGTRQHHLNLRIPETWEHHDSIGLEYDTSLGLKEDAGFRWGTCFPFHPLNSKKQPLNLLEIPLTIMDTPLLALRNPWQKMEAITDKVESRNGLLTILFHHSVLNENEYPGWQDLYKKLIRKCLEKDAWFATAEEINRWWRAREDHLN